MLYSVNTSVATDKVGLERGIELLIDAGFPALDHTVMPDFSYAIGKDALAYAKKLKDYAASRGVVFNQAHAPFAVYDYFMEHHVPHMPEFIRFAAALGAKNIIIHPVMKYRHYGHEEEHFEMNMEFYSSLAQVARDSGIKIAIENMWNNHPVTKRIEGSVCSTPEEFVRYLDTLGQPDVFTACLDTGHCALSGKEPENVIRALGSRIGAIHAHDVDYVEDLHTVPGTSKLNFEAIARALADVNYSGDFTLEIKGFVKNYPIDALPIAYRFMCETARYFAEKIEKMRAE